MTIDRTIDMCRSNARTDIVKSILASTSFENPKEAIAKFVIESNKETNKKQILSFRSNNNFKPNNQRINTQNRGFYRNYNRNFSNYRNNFNNNRRNFNNYRNNNRNNFQNNRGRNNSHNGQNRGRTNQNVKVTHSANTGNPRSMTLGETENWRQD